MLAFLNQVRKPTLDLPLEVRRKMWFKPFMQSYLVVFIGYLTMYLIRKNFNIAQNDMISTYGLSMTQLGMIGLGFSITYGLGKAEELFGEEISEEDKETESTDMTKWQIFVEYVLKNKVIWLLCFANIFLYVVRIGIDQWSTVYAFQELKLSKAVAIQGFTLFEAGALVGTLLWGWLSDLANGRRGLVACIALALIIATLGVYQHASNEYIYLASLFALGFLVFGPQLLIGVAAVGFVPKKAIGAADGIKGTFAYLIGDSFAKLGLGMIADGTPVFGLTGWAGTFAALDIAAIGCICLMAIVAVMEERKIRREKKIQQLTVA
ncbi:TPA: MFS transporter [Escherichia coli]|nr:MFS transporter [Escherichia coli]